MKKKTKQNQKAMEQNDQIWLKKRIFEKNAMKSFFTNKGKTLLLKKMVSLRNKWSFQ